MLTRHLRSIIDESIVAPLAVEGLERTGELEGLVLDHFRGVQHEFVREVFVERDKWWSKQRGRFSVGIVVQPLTAGSQYTLDSINSSAQTSLRELMDGGHDWKIWATDEKCAFVSVLHSGIVQYGIPWLNELSKPESHQRWLEENW